MITRFARIIIKFCEFDIKNDEALLRRFLVPVVGVERLYALPLIYLFIVGRDVLDAPQQIRCSVKTITGEPYILMARRPKPYGFGTRLHRSAGKTVHRTLFIPRDLRARPPRRKKVRSRIWRDLVVFWCR